MTCTAFLRPATVVGRCPRTRRELSPRPMPISMRPPEMRFSVANRLAVTVRSQTAGLVTIVPSRTLLVLAANRARIG